MAKSEVHVGGMPGMSVDHGTVVGRRGAGLNTHTGGDPMLHSFNHYGKAGLPPAPDLTGAMGMGGMGMGPMPSRSPLGMGHRMNIKGMV